ncbi:unnamed protein product [marine sediment metagenome]|uniref:Uncharacterized protein n=1 Tax=marine sediment metagenome TaxID=412755 RepID=X1B1A3_9ZZZZ
MARNQKADIEKLVWPKDGQKFQWLDRLETILSVATKAGVAYAGFNAFKHPMGALYGVLGLRLAESPGALPSNLVGVAMLAHIGITNMQVKGGEYTPSRSSSDAFRAQMTGGTPPDDSNPWLQYRSGAGGG